MKVHELKCWGDAFEAVRCGLKTFEVRINDRGFKVGDFLFLKQWENSEGETGNCIMVKVDFIYDLHHLIPGYVGMSIHKVM